MATTNFLRLTSLEDNNTIALTQVGSPYAINIEYRTDLNQEWQQYAIDTQLTLFKDSWIEFRNTSGTFSKTDVNYYKFTSTKKFNVSGRIGSLLFYSQELITATVNYAFYSLFRDCTQLVDASQLDINLDKMGTSGCAFMFFGCTSLTQAPALPATTLANECYSNMFYRCSSLTQAPTILPATTLASACYISMFNSCTSLTETPELPATTLATNCYINMFKNCTSLTKMKYSALEFPNTNQSATWLDNTPAGTFYYTNPLLAVNNIARTSSGIPANWTITHQGATKSSLKLDNKLVSGISLLGKNVSILSINGNKVFGGTSGYKLGYSSDGLLCMFDGIKNIGEDKDHSSSTTAWKNLGWLGDKYNAVIASLLSTTWQEKCFSLRGGINQRPYIENYLMRDWMKGEWTVQMYCSAASGQYSNYRGFFGGHGSGSSRGLVGGQFENGTIAWALHAQPLIVFGASTSDMPPIGQKALFTMTSSMQNSRLRVLINDEEKGYVTASDVPLNYSGDQFFLLGAANTGNNRVGYLDIYSVRIYNRELNDQEIAKSLQNDIARFG